MNSSFDICITGAGIVGLATAYALTRRAPHLKLVVLEKETDIAAHQTGHNSGVLHQGIYYKPGSLKAKLCVDGARQMAEFCEANGIALERVGKLIVATTAAELPRLDLLYERARANGVPGVRRVGENELKTIEPHAAGLAGLHSPNTAILDYKQVAQALRQHIETAGGSVQTGTCVTAVAVHGTGVVISTHGQPINARYLVNCAGLYSDEIAHLAGATTDVRIVPFRGEYYLLKPEYANLVRGLIYPVTDPQLPFLGVHFTRRIEGGVEAGPNAVFALAREGYSWKKLDAGETLRTLEFPGFWRMARRWWRTGVFEYYRSFSKAAFVRSLQKLVPNIRGEHLVRGGAGVRAQAVNARGELLDDFVFQASPQALHVLNAPSPAASASLAIGEYIAQRVLENFN